MENNKEKQQRGTVYFVPSLYFPNLEQPINCYMRSYNEDSLALIVFYRIGSYKTCACDI